MEILPQSSFFVQVWLNFPTRIHHVLIRLAVSVEIRKAGRQRTSYAFLKGPAAVRQRNNNTLELLVRAFLEVKCRSNLKLLKGIGYLK